MFNVKNVVKPAVHSLLPLFTLYNLVFYLCHSFIDQCLLVYQSVLLVYQSVLLVYQSVLLVYRSMLLDIRYASVQCQYVSVLSQTLVLPILV